MWNCNIDLKEVLNIESFKSKIDEIKATLKKMITIIIIIILVKNRVKK